MQCRIESPGVHCQPQGVNRRTTAGPDILFHHFTAGEAQADAEVDSGSEFPSSPEFGESEC